MKLRSWNLGVLGWIILHLGCGVSEVTPWMEPLDFFPNYISNYHDNSIGIQSIEKSGNQAVYIDFSDGIKVAMEFPTINSLFRYISGQLTGEQIDWFGLGEKNYSGLGRIPFEKNRDFFNLVTSPKSYDDIYAPIEDALKLITDAQNDALLITDFEEYTKDRTEQLSPYAMPYFRKWLDEGNSITFYYLPYDETNNSFSSTKNIYFVLFTYGRITSESLQHRFQNAIKSRSGLEDLKVYEINPNPYVVLNNYGGKNKSGLTPDEISITDLNVGDEANVIRFFTNGYANGLGQYEAIEFSYQLNELYQFYFFSSRRFSRNLFLDASQDKIYELKNIKVNVIDVTDDYERFVKYTEAKKVHPALVKDEGNNDVWDDESAANSIVVESYIENTIDLKKEMEYQYNPGATLTEIFDFDQVVFSDRLKNSPEEVELITTFHNNFSGKLKSSQTQILRVDYLIEDTEEIYSDQLLDFKWKSIINESNGINSSLFESIRNTLQAVKPKGILYSYYLKFD